VLNLDPAKLLVILVVAFLVLGPERLPRVARQLGAAWRELTRIQSEVREEVRSAFPTEDLPHIPSPTRAISGMVQEVRGAMTGAITGVVPPAPRAPGSIPRDATGGAEPPPVASPGPSAVDVGLGEFTLSPDDPSLN